MDILFYGEKEKEYYFSPYAKANHLETECTYLDSLIIPPSVTSIGNRAFAGCCVLTSIGIPSTVTSIGDGAFNGCI